MNEVQEAAILEAELAQLGADATADQLMQAFAGYSDSAVQIALRRTAGGGGTAPVSCVLIRNEAIDVHDSGAHPMLWDSLVDNIWDQNALESVPAGLGLAFTFDGSTSGISTTESGTWSFTFNVDIPGDATWEGFVDDGLFGAAPVVRPGAGTFRGVLATVLTLPADAHNAVFLQINTETTATMDPLGAAGRVSIVRLG